MRSQVPQGSVQVSLPLSFINALLQMHGAFEPDLLQSLQERSLGDEQFGSEADPRGREIDIPASRGKYAAEFLGVAIYASTLPKVFSQIVDLMAEVAPDALKTLATHRSRKRRFVARNRDDIHPGRSDLRVLQSSSGWWISGNIGLEDLKRALRELTDVAGLTFGQDMVFPATPHVQ